MSFWTVHGYFVGPFFLLFLFLFPRFTMLALVALPVGMVAWLGEPFGLTGFAAACVAIVGWVTWLLAPRFLVAILATMLYGANNPVLCIGAWLLAFVMLAAKKKAAKKMAQERQQRQEESERLAAEEELRKKYAGAKAKQRSRTRSRAKAAGKRAQQWWDVLGVSPTASAEAIKSAYRTVAKATHPDSASDGKGDVERFRKANEAYQKGLKRKGT